MISDSNRVHLKKKRKRLLSLAAVTTALVALTVHYLIIVLHLLPLNAITILHPQPVESYIDPFFGQNWHMFAPDPPLVNKTFLIQMSVRPRVDGKDRLTEWLDVTTPVLTKMSSNPFSPAVTRYRTIDGIFGRYTNFLVRRTAQPNYKYSVYDLHVIRVFNGLLVALAAELYNPKEYRLIAIRGRVILEDIPPFSELQSTTNASGDLRAITSDWFPPEPGDER